MNPRGPEPISSDFNDLFEDALCSVVSGAATRNPYADFTAGGTWVDVVAANVDAVAVSAEHNYLVAQYARLRPRRGHKKALGAVKHSIIVACWHMLSTGELYTDLGGDYFAWIREAAKTTERLVAQLERLPP